MLRYLKRKVGFHFVPTHPTSLHHYITTSLIFPIHVAFHRAISRSQTLFGNVFTDALRRILGIII
jgi:K+-transporting ATPase A subunit